jgi:hypothetical protein
LSGETLSVSARPKGCWNRPRPAGTSKGVATGEVPSPTLASFASTEIVWKPRSYVIPEIEPFVAASGSPTSVSELGRPCTVSPSFPMSLSGSGWLASRV